MQEKKSELAQEAEKTPRKTTVRNFSCEGQNRAVPASLDLAADMMEAAAEDRDALAPQKQSYRLSKIEGREQAARKLERKRLRRIQEEEQMRMEEEQYNNFGRGGGMAPQRVGTPAQFQRPLGSWV